MAEFTVSGTPPQPGLLADLLAASTDFG
jgi:hypothetical protein